MLNFNHGHGFTTNSGDEPLYHILANQKYALQDKMQDMQKRSLGSRKIS